MLQIKTRPFWILQRSKDTEIKLMKEMKMTITLALYNKTWTYCFCNRRSPRVISPNIRPVKTFNVYRNFRHRELEPDT